jgi:hypothetical protein
MTYNIEAIDAALNDILNDSTDVDYYLSLFLRQINKKYGKDLVNKIIKEYELNKYGIELV